MAARAIALLPGESSVEPLDAALARTRAAGAASLLARALTACLPPLSSVPEAALDDALARRAPTLVPGIASPDGLPPISWPDGSAMSAGALRWLLDRSLATEAIEDAELADVIRRLPGGTTEALCDAIVKRVKASGKKADALRALRLQALLGGDSHIMALGQGLEKRVKSPTFSKALQALVDHARLRGGGPGILWLDRWARRATRPRIRRQVGQALNGLRDALGLTHAEALDRAVPTLGFDAAGCQRWALSPSETLTVTLGDGWQIELQRGDKITKSLPRAASPALKARLKDLKAALKRTKGMVSEHLERAMCADRRWPVEACRALFTHPLVARLSGLLVTTDASLTCTIRSLHLFNRAAPPVGRSASTPEATSVVGTRRAFFWQNACVFFQARAARRQEMRRGMSRDGLRGQRRLGAATARRGGISERPSWGAASRCR